MPEPEPLLNQREALKRSGLKQWYLTMLVEQGRLRRYKRGGRAYYSRADIDEINAPCEVAIAA